MTYKNGVKEYTLTTLLFGIPIGALVGFAKLNVFIGALAGFISGLSFSFLVFIFVKLHERKFDRLRQEITNEREIICDGMATIKGIGGWIFLTDSAIEFYPHKETHSLTEMIIPLDTVKSVKTRQHMIILLTGEKSKVKIEVSRKRKWKKLIMEEISGDNPDDSTHIDSKDDSAERTLIKKGRGAKEDKAAALPEPEADASEEAKE